MSIEDLHAMMPLPPVGPEDLGVSPPPPAFQSSAPMPMAQPPGPSKGQQIVKLAALASMLAGGPSMAGLGAGVLQGQRQREEETRRQQLDQQRLQQQQFEMDRIRQQDAQRQQQAWQQQVQQKQQLAASAAQNFRQRVAQGEFKDYAAYETAAKETSALLQNYYGMRIGPQYFMQAAQFRTKDDEQIIFEQLQKAFANPLSGKNIGPDDVITFKGSDGTPRRIPVAQAVAASSYPVVLDPSGKFKPVGDRQMSPSEAAGAAGDFEERKRLKIASGIAYDTPAQQASVNQQIRKEMAADELKRKREERATLGIGDGHDKKSWITRGGKVIHITDSQIQPGDVPYSPTQNPDKPPTEGQSKAAGYGARVQTSTKTLDNLENSIAGMYTLKFRGEEALPPGGQSATFQSYDQAARNFINAVLRRESGAAISAQEFADARRQYLPMPGDKPQTLAQKRQNRLQILASLKQEAGHAWREPVELDDPAARARRKLSMRPMPSHGGN